ncbi:MAG: FAD-dependent oxidoreductase [Actinomycetota bacterium]
MTSSVASSDIFASDFSEDPWWWRDAPPVAYPEHPAAGADVVVVGGGYAGLSCATEVALAGKSVMVLDVRRVGEGASGRNAGLVSGRAGISKMIDLEGYVGPARAAAILDEADRAYVHFQQLVADHAPGAFQDRGRFVAARSPFAFRKLEKKYREYRDTGEGGSPVELVPPGDEGRFITTDAFHGGMATADAGLAHPARFVDGLRRRAEAAGVSLHTGVRVVSVDPGGLPGAVGGTGSGYTVTISVGSGTARGHRRIAAGEVVIATNGYTDRAAPWHRERIVPMSSTILALERLGPERVESLLPAMTTVIDTNRVIVYARPTPDGDGILFGGRARFRPVSTETSARILHAQMLEIFPSLADVRVTNAWSGLMAFTADYLPKVGRHDDGTWFALGCNGGSGVVLMPWLGRAVGRRIAGTDAGGSTSGGGASDGGAGTQLSALDGLPYERQPLGRHTSKLIAAAGFWYGLRDRIDNRRP